MHLNIELRYTSSGLNFCEVFLFRRAVWACLCVVLGACQQKEEFMMFDMVFRVLKRVFVLPLFLIIGVVPAMADQVVPDDLIVNGESLCVGFDCVDGEVFGFNTVILKENNLRIFFDDTSATASYPANDWEIVVNDSSNGGSNYFLIQDATAGTRVFRLDAGAPSNSLYVDSAGDVGLGTSNPLTDLHIQDNDTPTIRLEQDGSFWPAYTWDIAGNESNFFVRDATAGTLPFRIKPGAPESSLMINSDGSIMLGEYDDCPGGIGTDLNGNLVCLTDPRPQVDGNSYNIATLQGEMEGVSWTGDGSTVGASAVGTGSTAVGDGASASTRDTAVGYMATVTADGSTAIGANTTIATENSVAIGADATVDAVGGTAVGQNASVAAGATGSVALGQDSEATEPNTVSVGSSTNQRRVTNVADGVDANDAVTVQQLQQSISLMEESTSYLEGKIDSLDERLDDVGAVSAAFSAMVPNYRAAGDTQLSLGLGNYSGSNALAAGVFHYVNDNILLNAGVSSSFNSDGTASRAGITIGF